MGREIYSFNRGWSFHKNDIKKRNFRASHADRFESSEWLKAGNMGIAKTGYPEQEEGEWKRVDLPHDFILENEFSQEANYVHGSIEVGIGWYRKEFYLEKEPVKKRIFLEFDGIFRNSMIWVNGHFVGSHLSGYTSFSVDITDVSLFGEANAVAVRVDASEFELWSYEGGGIYRDVRLVKTPWLYIPQWGTFVTAVIDEPVINKKGTPLVKTANMKAELSLLNTNYSRKKGEIHWELIDPQGEKVSEELIKFSLESEEKGIYFFETELKNPQLWDVEMPHLYQSVFTVTSDEDQDIYSHETGIRHFRFDSEKGFFLNGRNLKLKGTCCHQDHGCVGSAVPYSLQKWRVAKLKEMGSNAIRTSHNPADPSLLKACDKLGMLVMDEHRMIGTSQECMNQLGDLIMRGRNNPSVIIWSLGNEEVIQHSETTINILRRMQALAHKLDPTRVTTYAMNANWIKTCDFYAENDFKFDVFGSNYRSGQRSEHYDEFHNKHPQWPMVGTETGGSASTRGVYEPPQGGNYPLKIGNYGPCKNIQWTNPEREGYVSAYGETCTPWGYSIEDTWKDCASRSFLSGTFLWTGFDYRGETFPYGWPSVITRYGLMDLCGFPKDAFYYYQAWWRSHIPMVHIFPHWDWPGKEGESIEVWCYGNTAFVELLLNGRSLGKKSMEKNGHLQWDVPYEPGTLEAFGTNEGGTLLAKKALKTPSSPSQIELSWDNPLNETAQGNGESVLVINARIIDNKGEWCQRAEHTVSFEIQGEGIFLGSGNGNPVSLEKDSSMERNAYCGLCQIIVRAAIGMGDILITATAPGMKRGELTLTLIEGSVRPSLDRYEDYTLKEEIKGEIDNLL
jgi:beta-galactosidase